MAAILSRPQCVKTYATGFRFYCQPCCWYGQPSHQEIFYWTIRHDHPPWFVLCSSINKACDFLCHCSPIIFKLLLGMIYHGSTIHFHVNPVTWWRHQMKTLSALLAICAGNSPDTGELPAQRPVTRSFDVFFYLRLIMRLSKQSWGWWFETSSRNEVTAMT